MLMLMPRTLFVSIAALLLLIPMHANCSFARCGSSLPATPPSSPGVGNPNAKKTAEMNAEVSPDRELQLSESRNAFIEWAIRKAIPIHCMRPLRPDDDCGEDRNDPFLSYLDGVVERSSASVVVLSEGFHNCKEMMSLHHRIVQHLSMHRGFRLVGTESGLPESRDIADYVTTSLEREYSETEKEVVWRKGMNKMYGAWVEGRETVEWMREFNKKNMRQSDDMISYCGLDIGGFYSDWTYPMSKIKSYIEGQFPEFEAEWSRKIEPILNIMGTVRARHNYQYLLTPSQKSTLAMLLDELVTELNSHGDELDGDFEFEWAKQSAISMRLAENYYRNYENMVLSNSASGGNMISKYSGLDGREIAMAHNAMWTLNLYKEEASASRKKMVIINHIIHTKTATQYQGEVWGHFVPMGQLFKQMLKCDDGGERSAMLNIGMLYGGGTFWNKWQNPRERFVDVSPAPSDNGLESVMQQISKGADMPNFFLHWELAPKEAWMYLNSATMMRENDYNILAYPLEWNGCIYLDTVSPATPAEQ